MYGGRGGGGGRGPAGGDICFTCVLFILVGRRVLKYFFFSCWYVLPRFSKVGSLELIFLASNWGLQKEFSPKFVSQELKLSQNGQKLGLLFVCLFVLSLFWIKLFQYISTGLPRGPDLNKHIYKISKEKFLTNKEIRTSVV